MLSWSEQARAAIALAVDKSRAAGLDVRATIVAIDAVYPFAERRYWPYKCWLRERRKAIDALTRSASNPSDPLSRRCTACGAAPHRPCRQIGDDDDVVTVHAARTDGPLFEER